MFVDDHDLVRQALIEIFRFSLDFEVIGEASNGEQALEILKFRRPDILFLDVEMPLMNGRETLKHVKKLYPTVKVVILTMYNEKIYEREFMDSGAHSFLSKGANIKTFIDTISLVSKTRYPDYTKNEELNIAPIHDKHYQLSLSEIEKNIIKFMCNDETIEQISFKLDVNVHTIVYYRRSIYKKTRTKSIAELVKYAIRNGLINSD